MNKLPVNFSIPTTQTTHLISPQQVAPSPQNTTNELAATALQESPSVSENQDLSGRGAIVDTRAAWRIPEKNLNFFTTFVLKICRLWNHFKFKDISCLPAHISEENLSHAKTQRSADDAHSGAIILGNATKLGEELQPSHINLYFQETLAKEQGIEGYTYVHDYVYSQTTIHTKDANGLINQLSGKAGNSPVVIPFVIPKSLFSENHIALIMVKNDKIYYVDSKGPTLDDQKTRDGQPLREVLEKAFPGMPIEENQVVHQECISNCGAYVCKFATDILKNENPSFEARFGLKEIAEFRLDMFSKFYHFFAGQGQNT